MAEDEVVLVDQDDVAIGTAPKLAVHRTGQRHRAVSVFVFDRRGKLLLQRRADTKYHSAGLWSNTCCGHPRPGESAIDAAGRRLRAEMGLECDLTHVTTFEYTAHVSPDLIEHEIDHVFTGVFDGVPVPDPAEVGAWAWVSMDSLARDCQRQPERYSAWLPLALTHLTAHRRA